jgi:hypothetical protein
MPTCSLTAPPLPIVMLSSVPRLFLTCSRRLSFFSVMAQGDLQGPRPITDHLVELAKRW